MDELFQLWRSLTRFNELHETKNSGNVWFFCSPPDTATHKFLSGNLGA